MICGEAPGDHAGHCPVPAAEAALERLENEGAYRRGYEKGSKSVDCQEAFERAREQAAGLRVTNVHLGYDRPLFEMAVAEYRATIRAMKPDAK